MPLWTRLPCFAWKIIRNYTYSPFNEPQFVEKKVWILVVYGVLVLSVPGYPTNYKFTVETGATLTSVAASHFFQGYFNSLPVNKQNIISSSLIILSYVTEYQVCRSYIAAIVLNFLPDKASFLLSEYPTICWLTIGFRPIASVLVLSIFLVVA